LKLPNRIDLFYRFPEIGCSINTYHFSSFYFRTSLILLKGPCYFCNHSNWLLQGLRSLNIWLVLKLSMKGWNSKTLLTCFTDFRRLGAQWIHHFSRRKTISPTCALFVPRVAHEILTGKKWKIQHITGTYFVYTIQDFLSKLVIKPHVHLVEKVIFYSLINIRQLQILFN
jgi:hypothetical protein